MHFSSPISFDPPQLRVATRVSLIFRLRCQDTRSSYDTIQKKIISKVLPTINLGLSQRRSCFPCSLPHPLELILNFNKSM